MIILPKGAFTVIADKAEEKTKSGIILTEDIQEVPNSGTIAFTSEELNEFQGCRVVFRMNFAEDIEIDGTPMKYFRDLNSSIYYIIK